MERYLTTATSAREADIIETLLAHENIPVIRRNRRSDSYMKIHGYPGVDEEIYVPADMIENAMKLLAQSTALKDERASLSGTDCTAARKWLISHTIIIWFIRLLLLIIFVVVLLSIIPALLQNH